MRWSLILAAAAVVGVLIVVPVVHVFAGALSEGVRVYWDEPRSAIPTRVTPSSSP